MFGLAYEVMDLRTLEASNHDDAEGRYAGA